MHLLSHTNPIAFPRTLTAALVLSALGLVACNDSNSETSYVVPTAPVGVGYEETADPASTVTAYVDAGASNQRGKACMATLETNAGVRVAAEFLKIWRPRTLLVDAGQTAAADGDCPAVTSSDWDGIPGSATDGTIVNADVHAANIRYVETLTAARTSAQELAAYLDDRRGKNFSISDGMGPLTHAWRAGSQQFTTITEIAADATTVKYDDKGNNRGVGSNSNPDLGLAVDFIGAMSGDGSTEPAKRFYKYARPWRWSSQVRVVPALEPAKSSTPATDGGFLSGHSAEAVRDSLAMAYLVPERFQEMLARGLELGENRILAGMHSPLDVIGGRIQGTAVVAYNLNKSDNLSLKADAYAQAQSWLQGEVGVSDASALYVYAHSGSDDRFSDYASNKTDYLRRLTFGFTPIAATTSEAVIPKGAEVLLETRLPYLSAEQRRVVLKTTALPSGYPLLDDAEGWGRLNLFAAADGYGAFNGDVRVLMDGAQGGFHAADSWKNDITGAGLLTKSGSGNLTLSGANSWSGGTLLQEGTLTAASTTALGTGDLFQQGGTLAVTSPLQLSGNYTQQSGSTLQLQLGNASAGRVSISGKATLEGALEVSFRSGYQPAVGDTLQLLHSGQRHGSFSTVTASGYQVTPLYTATGVQLRIDGKNAS
jgi:autotransporter-associated beta strand protein